MNALDAARVRFVSECKLEFQGPTDYLPPMPMSMEQIEKEVLALSGEARARLADLLVESLTAADATRIDELWAAESKRRRDEVRQGKVKTIPGPEGLARVRRSLGRLGHGGNSLIH